MTGPVERIRRSLRLRHGRPHVREANLLRDRGDWVEAVVAYKRALDWMPWRDDLHVQVGNCFKEYGDYEAATRAYQKVIAGPQGYEAFGQIEDVNRRRGRPVLLSLGADEHGAGADAARPAGPIAFGDFPNRLRIETAEPRRFLGTLGQAGGGLAARWKRWNAGASARTPAIAFDQVGALLLTRDGLAEPLLAGVVAVRVSVMARPPSDTIELWLGVGAAAVRIATAPLRHADGNGAPAGLRVANIWIDSAELAPGRHWLSARVVGHAASAGLHVTVADRASPPLKMPMTDGYVPSPPGRVDDLAAAVIAEPARARSASRSLFDRPIRSILALRADQLGDVSASLAAIARLRTLFPDARVTVLVQPSIAALVTASGIADDVLTITLAYDPATERRALDVAEEARVRALCAERGFDLAIDLCPGEELRPLLLLTGATYLVGFNADRFGFLDYGVAVRSRDKANQLNIVSHAAVVMTLVEGLALATATTRPVVARTEPGLDILAAHGLEPDAYVVLHTGARHAINRWPAAHFLDVADHILATTSLRVVVFGKFGALAGRIEGYDRTRLTRLETIDDQSFDAIVSSARLVIGNDSGPKHLAAVRGVPTISLHVNRLNWNEWGQEGRGVVLSKRVPCAGCGLNDIARCGRDAVCLRSIGVDEVLAAAAPYLGGTA